MTTWLIPLLLLSSCASLVVGPRTSVEAVIKKHLSEPAADDREPQSVPNFLHPVAGKSKVSSAFGLREGRAHQGLDFTSAMGNPIQATADGEVVYVGNGISGYGNTVILKHEGDYFSLYAHLSETYVEEGQPVTPGNTMARTGASGNATGPHLHFEIRKRTAPLDPLKIAAWLKETDPAKKLTAPDPAPATAE